MEKYTLDAPRLKSLISNLHSKVMTPAIFEPAVDKMYVIDFNTFLLSQSDNKTVELHRYADSAKLKDAFQFVKLNRRKNSSADKYHSAIIPAYREFLFEMALLNLKIVAYAGRNVCVKCYANVKDMGGNYGTVPEPVLLKNVGTIIEDKDTLIKYLLDNFGKEMSHMSLGFMKIIDNTDFHRDTLCTAIGYMELIKDKEIKIVEVPYVNRIEE